MLKCEFIFEYQTTLAGWKDVVIPDSIYTREDPVSSQRTQNFILFAFTSLPVLGT